MIEKKRVPGTADESRFVETMRRVREIRGLSQGDLAARLADAGWDGFRQTTISRIEKGERTVRLAEAHAIAQVLGVPLTRMMDESAQEGTSAYAQRIREIDGLIGDFERQISGHREKLSALEQTLSHYRGERERLTAAYAGSGSLAAALTKAIVNDGRVVEEAGHGVDYEA